MKYQYLEKTGIQISELCFGTMTFGKEAGEDESRKMFHHYLDTGIIADLFFQLSNEIGVSPVALAINWVKKNLLLQHLLLVQYIYCSWKKVFHL